MDKEMKTKEIDVASLNEAALDNLSHLLTKKNWHTLLVKRLGDWDHVTPLSAKFILEHKNELNLDMLTLFGAFMKENPQFAKEYDLDFFHRFWAFATFDGGADSSIASVKLHFKTQDPAIMEIIKQSSNKDTAAVLLEDTDFDSALPTFKEYDKNPYFYDATQLATMVQLRSDNSMDFMETYVHLFPFSALMANKSLTLKKRQEVIKRFGVEIENTRRYLLPDGSVVEGNQLDTVTDGYAYLDNINRYATENEKAIREIIEKFPRAVKDCFDEENAKVMQKK